MTSRDKVKYIQYTFIQKLRELDSATAPAFGKMNPQQMVEHLTNSFAIAEGKIEAPIANEGEAAEKAYKWLMSDAQFRDNTPNQFLPDEPTAVKEPSIGDAIDSLEDGIQSFIDSFAQDKSRKVQNSFFGELDYYEQVQLLYKHVQHHARQFGIA
jgi:hypothetical protein